MKPSEVAELLASVAATDNRTVGRLDVTTWHAILPADMTLVDAHAALIQHRRTSTEWVQPKHVADLVAGIRRARLDAALNAAGGVVPLPGGLDQADERAWAVLWRTAAKDGDPDPVKIANTALGVDNAAALDAVPMPEAVRRQIEGFARAHSVPAVKVPR